MMQVRGRCDGHGIHALAEQRLQAVEGAAIDKLGRARAMRLERIDHADQMISGKPASTRA